MCIILSYTVISEHNEHLAIKSSSQRPTVSAADNSQELPDLSLLIITATGNTHTPFGPFFVPVMNCYVPAAWYLGYHPSRGCGDALQSWCKRIACAVRRSPSQHTYDS